MTRIPNAEAHLVGWAKFHHEKHPDCSIGDGWRDVVAAWKDVVHPRVLKSIRGLYACARLALLRGCEGVQNHRVKVEITRLAEIKGGEACEAGEIVYTIRRKRG